MSRRDDFNAYRYELHRHHTHSVEQWWDADGNVVATRITHHPDGPYTAPRSVVTHPGAPS